MEFPEFDPQMTWNVGNISHFESDWIACHRLLALNAIDGEDLWKLLHGEKHAPTYSYQIASERYRGMILTANFLKKFAQHFKARSLEQCFGEGNAKIMLEVLWIRFCPSCLEGGFHSPFFQFASVVKCPLHMSLLKTSCNKCGKPIGKPKFDRDDFKAPMSCPWCYAPFIKGKAIGKTALGPLHGSEIFEAVERNISILKTWQYVKTRSLANEPRWLADYQGICDSLKMATNLQDKEYTKTYSERLVKIDEWERISEFYRAPLNIATSEDSLNEVLESLSRIIKSIGRHLRHRVRKICRHRYPLTLEWERDNRIPAVTPVLRFTPSDCPCCALINQWCAYSGKIISMRNIARGYNKPVYDNFNYMRRTYLLEANACAESLISSFTWFALTLVNRLNRQDKSFNTAWLDSDPNHIYHPRLSDEFYLGIHRFDIYFHGYVFEREGKECMYRYSLEFAIGELKACFEKRKVTIKRNFGYIRSSNQWYIPMWEYLLSLRDLRWSFRNF